MKKIIKKIFFIFLNILVPWRKGGSILMFHSIGHNEAFFTVTPKHFAQQLLYLHIHGYKVLSLSDFLMRLQKGVDVDGCVTITFDDAYCDFATYALPELKKYNFPAAVFVPIHFIGKEMTNSEGITLPIMNLPTLKSLKSHGVECYSHTQNHKELVNMDKSTLDVEILDAYKYILDVFEDNSRILAYPRGKYDTATIEYAKSHGVTYGLTVEDGSAISSLDMLHIKRNSIDSYTSFPEFISKIRGTNDIYVRMKKYAKLR